MSDTLAERDPAQVLETVIVQGDLKALSPADRVIYYNQVCRSLNLNPYTRPFEYITLNGKLTLYARRDATDQLRQLHRVSVTRLERERTDDLAIVVAHGIDKTGRTDSAIGAVSIKGLSGEALANALMKAETKAKRRLTLSMCGLGWTDESEVDSIPDAQPVKVDHATGELKPEPKLIRNADHPLWQRYLYVLSEAQGLGIKTKPLELGKGMPEVALITEGQRLTGLINKRKIEAATLPVTSDRMVTSVTDPVYQAWVERFQYAAGLDGFDTAPYELKLPLPASQYTATTDALEGAILAKEGADA